MTIPETTSDRFAVLAERAARRPPEVGALAKLRTLAAEPPTEPVRVIASSPLTVDEATGSLSLSRSAVYELMRTGELNSVQIGVRRPIPVAAVDGYVAQLTGAA